MFTQESFAWLEGLEANNEKTWFEAHRADYERHVRAPMEVFLADARAMIGGNSKIFRQHRDTRFSADKSPYRTQMIGTLHGRAGSDAGLYAELSSRGLLLASGNHVWEKDQLERYLAAVAGEPGAALADIVESLEARGWEIQGELLKGVPKGFDKAHPRARLLRHKFLVAARRFSPTNVIAVSDAIGLVAEFWKDVAPLNRWLDARVGLSALPTDRRR